MVQFFRYALSRGLEDYIRPAVRLSYGTDGGISYDRALEMGVWELSIVSDELDKISKEIRKQRR